MTPPRDLAPREPHACGWGPDDPRWEDEAATVALVDRPHVVEPHTVPPRRRSRPRPARLGLAAVAILAAVGLWQLVDGYARTERRETRIPPPTPTGAPAFAVGADCDPATTVTSTPPPPDELVQRTTAVVGSCTRAVTFDRTSGVLDVSGVGTFQVGGAGDWFGVGDWDCDGDETPVLYRPGTGEVFVFAAWADAGVVESAPPVVARPNATPTLGREGGCDLLLVDGRPVATRALP